jgi:hypothetical protein
VKPGEVQWRLMRAERRSLDGPEFKSPSIRLARALWQMRAFQIADKEQRKRNTSPRVYSYAIEHCKKRIESLLPLVPIKDLSEALSKLESANYSTDTQRQVLNACWAIFERTDGEPESGFAVRDEIKDMIRKRNFHTGGLPSLGTVYSVLNRLDIPTRRGKRGPARGSQHKKLPRKRA